MGGLRPVGAIIRFACLQEGHEGIGVVVVEVVIGCGTVIATGTGFRYDWHTAEKGCSSAVVKVGCGPVISTGAGIRYDEHTAE